VLAPGAPGDRSNGSLKRRSRTAVQSDIAALAVLGGGAGSTRLDLGLPDPPTLNAKDFYVTSLMESPMTEAVDDGFTFAPTSADISSVASPLNFHCTGRLGADRHRRSAVSLDLPVDFLSELQIAVRAAHGLEVPAELTAGLRALQEFELVPEVVGFLLVIPREWTHVFEFTDSDGARVQSRIPRW
jgi:hypothetical protein